MEQLTTTPFGQRPVTAGLIARAAAHQRAPKLSHIDKWSLFRDLCTARTAFGVTDRDLTVLNALLSFYPETNLSDNAGLIVFPSNAALSDRAHGMAESTLRRHLAALVHAGLIARHDSPNGKRYARRGANGEIARAFGFDLRPLLVRSTEIVRTAEAVRAAEAELTLAREAVSLLKRDALKLALYGQDTEKPGDWEAIQRVLMEVHKQTRRKLSLPELAELKVRLVGILRDIRLMMATEADTNTEKMSGSDAESERLYLNSDKDSSESEQSVGRVNDNNHPTLAHSPTPSKHSEPTIPLSLVLKACPDILPYCDGSPRSWRDLVTAAAYVRGMMGISPSAWDEAQRFMGSEIAAITVVCILQRFATIHSPGGYLRSLSGKAAAEGFSPGPMVMALLNTDGQRAA